MRRILRVLSTDQELTAREIARRTGLSTTEVAAFMCRHALLRFLRDTDWRVVAGIFALWAVMIAAVAVARDDYEIRGFVSGVDEDGYYIIGDARVKAPGLNPDCVGKWVEIKADWRGTRVVVRLYERAEPEVENLPEIENLEEMR
ncbi:MAG: AsnC family protein [Deltaproteobacteria bacterium]|nr:AsnC family protein [Deltaproteobacteria bacterium]